MKLNLVIAEAALELVPEGLLRDRSVVADAEKRGVESSRILLDRSLHHRAMLRLKDGPKRGRPDLVHVTLLSVTGSPLYMEGMVRVFVHTHGDVVLELEEKTRIPKSYFRFRGLVEQALDARPKSGLVKAYPATLEKLIKSISPDSVIGLSTQGRPSSFEQLGSIISAAMNPCVVIGGFAHGHFSRGTVEVTDELVSIHEEPLDAHVVVSRLLYEVEKHLTRTND